MLHPRERDARSAANSTLDLIDITDDARRLPAFAGHEAVWCGRDERSGLTAIVAIHDTTLGPALGGTRLWPHENFDAALTDALRLSRGMTYKAAIAGLPLGGGKAVIIADSRTDKTPELLTAYAEMLARLEDAFITAEDVGMNVADADFLRRHTPNVVGTSKGGSGNPSPFTAEGVLLGIKMALAHRHAGKDLSRAVVAIQGLGSVGWSLCGKLAAEGARLIVTDIDASRAQRAAAEFNARLADPDEIIAADADVFAPCALGGGISEATIPLLRSKIVAGSANNQLARHEDARLMTEKDILYAPDYVINAGGLINVAAELRPEGYDRAAAMTGIAKIPETLRMIFVRAEEQKRPTNDIAAEIAMERIRSRAR